MEKENVENVHERKKRVLAVNRVNGDGITFY